MYIFSVHYTVAQNSIKYSITQSATSSQLLKARVVTVISLKHYKTVLYILKTIIHGSLCVID